MEPVRKIRFLRRFSDIHLGEDSIEFKKRQLEFYTELFINNPNKKLYKKILIQLIDQLEDNKGQLPPPDQIETHEGQPLPVNRVKNRKGQLQVASGKRWRQTSRLEKGAMVWIPKDEVDAYLRTHTSDDFRLITEKIVNYCFSRKVETVIIFANNDRGNYRNVCYVPIFNNITEYGQYDSSFEDIEGCIFLDILFIENIRNIRSNEVLFTLKNIATRIGYWREDYAIAVF